MQDIHILGTGAMASLWGSYFSPDTQLHFITRSTTSTEYHYRVQPDGKEIKGTCINASQAKDIAYLIVATKAFDALRAIESVQTGITQKTEILVLQNGMGSQQAIANQFPNNRVYACSSTEGAYKSSTTELVHAGKGTNTIGALTPSATSMSLTKWLLPCHFEWHEDIQTVLWRKLVVNSAINPLTVLYDCQNGQLLENQSAMTLMSELCEEMDRLTAALDMDISNSLVLATEVCKRTANNYSSMYQDAKHNRQTEIDYITGYLIQQFEQQKILCPKHEWVYGQLKRT